MPAESVDHFNSQPFTSLILHRVNLCDRHDSEKIADQAKLVGSKSGIALCDHENVAIPLGSSVETDFWIFGEETAEDILITHGNPLFGRRSDYPTLNSFLTCWQKKKEAEKAQNIPHGFILANLKTHGQEEHFLELCADAGVSASEIVFLDLEYPAIDRLLQQKDGGKSAPLAIRLSRLESLEGVLMVAHQLKTFCPPRFIFYDPVGSDQPQTEWPFDPANVSEMYRLMPEVSLIVCCPSRWGKSDHIDSLANRLQQSNLKRPLIMTDLNLYEQSWISILRKWRVL